MANASITFREGEFTPQLDARSDVEKYGYGCRRLENMLPRIYSDVTRRPGTSFIAIMIDLDVVLPSIVSYENVGLCYENIIVLTLADNATNRALMPVFICYEDNIVCYENDPVVTSETAVLSSSMVCNENKVLFYENEILI